MGVLHHALLGLRNPDKPEHLEHPLSGLRLVEPLMEHDRLSDLVTDRVHRVEARQRLLEDHRDRIAANLAHVVLALLHEVDDLAVRLSEKDLAVLNLAPGTELDKPHDRQRSDRLARTRLAHDRQGLTLVKVERHPVDRRERAERDGEIADTEEWFHQRPRSFGLKASWRPSPIKENDSTVEKIASPGKVTVHQPLRKVCRFRPIICPQL